MEFIKKVLNSKKFFVFIIIFYILQSLFFAITVKPSEPFIYDNGVEVRGNGVVPDGNRHIAAIYMFAKKPLLSTPGEIVMSSDQVWIGDLERFPSYLYYYTLSWPVRIALFFNLSDSFIVLMIRLIGIVFGLVCILTLRKISKILINKESVANFATLAMISTGAFAYLTPAENYDIFSLMFFWLFILSSLNLIRYKDIKQLYFMAIIFFIGGLAKYTYIPFMGLFGLVSMIIFYRSNKKIDNKNKIKLSDIKRKIFSFAKDNRLKFVLFSSILIFSGFIFINKVGFNLIQYGSISPKCQKIHTHEECMNFGVYSRNFLSKKSIENNEKSDFNFDFIKYLEIWTKRYYYSTFIYYGHTFFDDYSVDNSINILGIVSISVFIIIIFTLFINKTKFKINKLVLYLIFVIIVLFLAQFLFNMRTYLNFRGETYAHQGRYLMSAYGLIYILLSILGYKFYKNIGYKFSKIFITMVLVFTFYMFTTLSALPMFFKYATTPDWYSNFSKEYIFKQYK